MSDISKIMLPSGNTYDIKDAYARDLIAELGNFNEWLGVTTTAISDGSTTNPVTINGTAVTATNGDIVTYQSKEFIWSQPAGAQNGTWQEFGDLSGIGAMAYVDKGTVTITPHGSNAASAVTFSGGTTDKVLGEATTFTNGTSSVSFGAHTTATVLTSSVTATVPKPSGTTKYMKATASGTAVGVATSGSALTGLGTADTDTFVKSYPGATSKLVTSTVTGVQSSTTTASKATAGTAVNVATTDTAKTVATGSLGTETSTRTADSPMWGATVSNETLSFTFKPMSTTSVTPAKSNGTITPYTFADVTVPIKATSATTVATGSLNASGGGASVMTGLGTATTASAVTGYSTPSTDTFAKTVSVTTQPTITLASESATATGRVAYISAVGTSGTNSVTFDTSTSGNTASAITALGAATAAAQTITVGTNDKVTAITSIGTGTAAAQTFSGTAETYDVDPKTT
jgi:hypothetical protein